MGEAADAVGGESGPRCLPRSRRLVVSGVRFCDGGQYWLEHRIGVEDGLEQFPVQEITPDFIRFPGTSSNQRWPPSGVGASWICPRNSAGRSCCRPSYIQPEIYRGAVPRMTATLRHRHRPVAFRIMQDPVPCHFIDAGPGQLQRASALAVLRPSGISLTSASNVSTIGIWSLFQR